MVFQLTSWPWTWMTFKGQIEVIEFLMGCVSWIVHVMTKVYMKHLYSKSYGLSVDLMTFDLGWPLKVKSMSHNYKCISSMNNCPMFDCFKIWHNYEVSEARCTNLSMTRQNTQSVYVLYEVGQIMSRYDFLDARWVILSNVRTDFNLN